MSELTIKLKPFQDEFLFSEKRFPALIASIGTGKTFMLLLKIWNFCEQYPDSLALIVRKEFTDLRDSTMKDFERYFSVTADSNKEYRFPNRSIIMFRHGAELNVLKNINLSIIGIEQAEEFESEETFDFLRDRLRRQNSPYRQLCLIANANGHNWIWRRWVNNKPGEEYHPVTANTFDNADNLPKDFIEDLKRMEQEAPAHYRRYVLNSFDEEDIHDILYPISLIESCINKKFTEDGAKILSIDPAEFGGDETVFSVLQKAGSGWKQTFLLALKEQDLMATTGRIVGMYHDERPAKVVIDKIGIGAGIFSRLLELEIPVVGFNGGEKARDEKQYFNRKAEAYYKTRKLMEDGRLQLINDETQTAQFNSCRFYYHSDGRKRIVPKDKMRADGLSSPDRAESVIQAVYEIEENMTARNNRPRQSLIVSGAY